MARPLGAERMLAALKVGGVTVREYRDWRTHNRNHMGSWGGVNGVVIHHTAGTNSLGLIYEGRSGLPGPLAHAHLSKLGLVSLTGHGRANHAGTFAQNAHDAVVNEANLHPGPDAHEPVDGNTHYYGLEIENLGNSRDPYPRVQYVQAVLWATAICREHGWTHNSVIGHKEGTRRKIDPNFDMNKFRADVKSALALPPGDWGTEKEESMALTSDDLDKIFTKVWKTDSLKAPVDSETNPTWMPYSFIRDNNIRLRDVQEDVVDLGGDLLVQSSQITELKAAVDALATGGVDLDALAIKVADEIYRRMQG